MKDLVGMLLFVAGAVLFGLVIGLLTDVIPFKITDSNWVLGAIIVVMILLGIESFRRSRRRQRVRRQMRASSR